MQNARVHPAVAATILALTALGLWIGVQRIQDARCPPLRVLFIGNSYTHGHDLPALVEDIAAAQGQCVEAAMVAPGGFWLRDHWEHGEALTRLRAGGWDVVVLQEQSQVPLVYPETMAQYAALLDGEVQAQGGRTLLFMTWAREHAPETQANLARAYYNTGSQIGAQVAPVGDVWQAVRRDHPELRLYEADQSHPTRAGAYISALVLSSMILQASPEGAPDLANLGPDQARAIQASVWQALGGR